MSESPNPELGTELRDDDETDEDVDEVDEGPDLLLREAARIVADQAELESNLELLENQFTQLSVQENENDVIN